jgi:hypothetical protein
MERKITLWQLFNHWPTAVCHEDYFDKRRKPRFVLYFYRRVGNTDLMSFFTTRRNAYRHWLRFKKSINDVYLVDRVQRRSYRVTIDQRSLMLNYDNVVCFD